MAIYTARRRPLMGGTTDDPFGMMDNTGPGTTGTLAPPVGGVPWPGTGATDRQPQLGGVSGSPDTLGGISGAPGDVSTLGAGATPWPGTGLTDRQPQMGGTTGMPGYPGGSAPTPVPGMTWTDRQPQTGGVSADPFGGGSISSTPGGGSSAYPGAPTPWTGPGWSDRMPMGGTTGDWGLAGNSAQPWTGPGWADRMPQFGGVSTNPGGVPWSGPGWLDRQPQMGGASGASPSGGAGAPGAPGVSTGPGVSGPLDWSGAATATNPGGSVSNNTNPSGVPVPNFRTDRQPQFAGAAMGPNQQEAQFMASLPPQQQAQLQQWMQQGASFYDAYRMMLRSGGI